MANKLVVSSGTISVKNSDGSYSSLDFIMPKEILEQIKCRIIDWKDEWVATTNTHEEFKKIESEFIK